ncbi:MAG: ATP-binding protein [Actinomycetota bacterium]|jgi:anti-sigma regulatory factor (Ser/Thr protein kinase)|nr:ATP-binding protein [Acidothermales bacterium]MDQ3432692.1 ATP-binding protein [Actinomycetota bacterium]
MGQPGRSYASSAPEEAPEEATVTSGTVLVPHRPLGVAQARFAFLTAVRGQLSDDRTRDAVLVLSELVSNALRHARPLPDDSIKAAWRLQGDTVEIAVTDGGSPTQPRADAFSPSQLGGRGLAIVNKLAVEWGVQEVESGTTVWASLGVPSPTPVCR